MSARVFILIMSLVSFAYRCVLMRLADLQRRRPLPAEVADVFEPGSDFLNPADAVRKVDDFVPVAEVMSEVDEKVVEQEKLAVRDLLDVREAKELAKFVEVGANSAAAGKWTYFRVKIDPLEDLKVVPKDVVVLMDASGSIANDRLRSCRAAATIDAAQKEACAK